MACTSHLLMIRPVHFIFNEQTAVNNAFQVANTNLSVPDERKKIQAAALNEFDEFVSLLRNNGIDVTVVDDTPEPHTPDSIFPNNWISFHEGGSVVLYPMFAENRRSERKPSVLKTLHTKFEISDTIDLTGYEKNNLFLEGTGSMVLDRDNKIVYACISPRTDKFLVDEFCKKMNYTPVVFTAVDHRGKQIYHTNVMMCVADEYVVICMQSIADNSDKKLLAESIRSTGKLCVEINYDQMNHFAGNMLQVQNSSGEKFLVMSTQAYLSLTPEQVKTLSSYNTILHSSLNVIEANGGGSARCMMAEVFLNYSTSSRNKGILMQ